MSKEKTAITARVPTSVARRVQEKLYDPVYKRTRYGAMNKLITRLLLDWLEDTENVDAKKPHDPEKPTLDLSAFKETKND